MLLQLHELLTYLGQRGVLTLLTVAQHGLVTADASAPVDVSYLADTVLLFRYFEADGAGAQGDLGREEAHGPARDTIRELTLGERRDARSAPPLVTSSAASSPACRSGWAGRPGARAAAGGE